MIKINFFGDFVVRDVDKLMISNDLNELISSADYNCLNFEAPLKGKSDDQIKKSGPSISMSHQAVDFLNKNNFNVISLANNHIMDNGVSGLKETLDCLYGRCLGAGFGPLAYEPKIVVKDGLKIAFLALTHKEFGCVVNEEDVGSAWMSYPIVYSIIPKIKSKVDFLFLVVHAGVEYLDVPIPEIRNLYRSYVDLGVDAVIASHPHVPQGYEVYKTKPIFYSLGNFCFQNEAMGYKVNKSYWNNSLAISFTISSSSTFGYEVNYIYYSQEDGVLSLDTRVENHAHVLKCSDILINKTRYYQFLSENLKSIRPYYISMFSGSGWYRFKFNKNFIKGILGMISHKKYNSVHLLNAFQCESHRWVLARMLEENIL